MWSASFPRLDTAKSEVHTRGLEGGIGLRALSYRPAGPRGRVVRSPALLHIRAHIRQPRAEHVAPDFLLLQQNGYGGRYGRGILYR